ncbi:aldo/keto reductase [Bifidobacterium sp. 82T24]|uniref:aldo/keto reductase n=1 Tax=Bifidobacterium pluvialisilvae TaxID=2834436 RepID=UPI001C59A425|nr:aldo/keto reductase [Bifidobacterium pluvialisilvae]MBW3088209.1 aldo/keto reductase [Bifidobacterium pluvialisilvae]
MPCADCHLSDVKYLAGDTAARYFDYTSGILFVIPKTETKECVLTAFETGFRHIDTAQSYFNEAEVGEAIAASGLDRRDVFVTTKVWIDNYGAGRTRDSVLRSLDRLRSDYIDLVLLHQPFNDYYAAWRDLIALQQEGRIRAIGVSNFSTGRAADLAAFTGVTPALNQIEANPLHQRADEQKALAARGIRTGAWAPFGEGKSGILDNPELARIAAEHGRTVAQAILRWLVQRGIAVLTKSTHANRIRENFGIFDFTLTDDDMTAIARLDSGSSVFFDYDAPETVDLFMRLVDERKGLA